MVQKHIMPGMSEKYNVSTWNKRNTMVYGLKKAYNKIICNKQNSKAISLVSPGLIAVNTTGI